MPVVAVLLALWFMGCATSPIAINQASPVPTSRILAPQLLAEAQYTGSLVIKRDGGFMGSACTIRVFRRGRASCRSRTVRKGRDFRSPW